MAKHGYTWPCLALMALSMAIFYIIQLWYTLITLLKVPTKKTRGLPSGITQTTTWQQLSMPLCRYFCRCETSLLTKPASPHAKTKAKLGRLVEARIYSTVRTVQCFTVGLRYNQDPVYITNKIWKPGRITVKYVEFEMNPAITNLAITPERGGGRGNSLIWAI